VILDSKEMILKFKLGRCGMGAFSRKSRPQFTAWRTEKGLLALGLSCEIWIKKVTDVFNCFLE
jgi:hypothetical protein